MNVQFLLAFFLVPLCWTSQDDLVDSKVVKDEIKDNDASAVNQTEGLNNTWRFAKVIQRLTSQFREEHRKENPRGKKTDPPGFLPVGIQPHIVLIVADDLGFNDVPWHNPLVDAPHLDSLARNGVILEQNYVSPVCTPTRASLMTGVYPFRIGRQNKNIKPMMPTGIPLRYKFLPETLKEAGYTTHMAGKWHLGFCKWEYTPTERGFDSFRGSYLGSTHYFHHTRKGKAPGSKSNYLRYGYDYRYNKEPFEGSKGIYSTVDVATHIEMLLHKLNPKKPTFLYLPVQSVHKDHMYPDKYNAYFRNVKNTERRNLFRMVKAMDDAIGLVLNAMKKTGFYDNSVIVFTTDNGGTKGDGNSNWPLRGHKGTLWEGGTRGVSFIHSPFLKANGTSSYALIHATDWFTTLAKLGGGIPPRVDGMDVWKAIQGEEESPRKELIYNIDDHKALQAAIRVGKFKLLFGESSFRGWYSPPEGNITESWQTLYNFVVCSPAVKKSLKLPKKLRDVKSIHELLKYKQNIQLYNIEDDPSECHDVSVKHPEVVNDLLRRLLSYKDEIVPADVPPIEFKGSPISTGGIWSPGWC